ncbi:methyltransferase domain-containing protein [Paenibacillus sp. 32352]|uniref:class I SAM-dependent methyltransferase n=1 Tax=Paenibacillus sp. 32352 TaxID=1969111 RepID=UPI0009AEAB13|nr:methyltransferase domain-containing protein [Paenibacillus sp. 32352]
MVNKHYEQAGVAMTCRSFTEYELMFALDKEQLQEGPILDVASGASSFSAEAAAKGYRSQAADPLYSMDAEAIREHGEREIELSTRKLDAIKDVYDWSYYGDLDRHRAMREQSLQRFIEDFKRHEGSDKYTAARLPELPFDNDSFSLVLCSHFLFLYQEQFDEAFHLQAVRELLRVCRQGGRVLIYPLYSLRWERYPALDSMLAELSSEGITVETGVSRLAFIPESTEFLILKKSS